MEGRLRKEKLEVEIATSCAHCGRAMHITMDETLRWRVRERGADPHIFLPQIDWSQFREPNIIGHF